MRERVMVRPHNEALRATGPLLARSRFPCSRVYPLASQVRLVPRAPRRRGRSFRGFVPREPAPPALTPSGLHHRRRPDPCFTSSEGGRVGRNAVRELSVPGGDGSEGCLNGAGPAGWRRESGSRLRQSAALGLPGRRGPGGEWNPFTGRSVKFQGAAG
jgi:hypothetical protein